LLSSARARKLLPSPELCADPAVSTSGLCVSFRAGSDACCAGFCAAAPGCQRVGSSGALR
jgi:hypothetical protein